jgi:D-3-phosphoglycerate dehydrogenase / 2-oxoglutarate reductase
MKIWLDEAMLPSCVHLLDGFELIGPGAPESQLAGCVGTLVPGCRWDAARMDRAPKLRVLSRIGVGYDLVDVDAASERGIVVCYAPAAPSVSTAEHSMALLLALAKRVVMADRTTRAGAWHPNFTTVKGFELRGRTLGLVGVGRIGAMVAEAGRGFGMHVIGFDPYLSADRAAQLGITQSGTLDDLLAQADVVSLHTPVTAETRGLINAARLAQMKRGALLINAARGALIDEPALVAALRSGHLGGAGLDVFAEEPPPKDHPLFGFDNVVLTDHIASHTWAGHDRLYETAIRHLLMVLRDEMPHDTLNPAIWPGRRR